MPTRCTPGVRGICARYIEPNLPAPIRPMRIGLPSACALLELCVQAHREPPCFALRHSPGSGLAAHAAIFSSSIEVSSALAGMPFFHGSSTG